MKNRLRYAITNKVKWSNGDFEREEVAVHSFLSRNLNVAFTDEFEISKEELEKLLRKLKKEAANQEESSDISNCIFGKYEDFTYSYVIQFLENCLQQAEESDMKDPFIRFCWF